MESKTQMNIAMKQKQTYRHREQTCVGKVEGGRGRDKLGVWDSRSKLSYMGWINNKVLLYSTGNYIQYLVITHNRKEYEKQQHVCLCVCITESLCCVAEGNTTQ